MSVARPFNIPKELVAAAFRAVKSNAGGAGIDKETIGQFESKVEDNLYKIWNWTSSGEPLPAAGQGGCHSEEEWRGKNTWRPYGLGSGGSDGGQDGA